MDRNKFNNNKNNKSSFNPHKHSTSSNQPYREFGKKNNRRQYASSTLELISFNYFDINTPLLLA